MEFLISSLVVPTSLAVLVYLWIDTDAVEEYFGWFLRYIPPFKQYLALKKSGDLMAKQLGFPLWLVTDSPNFLTKLISCPFCCSLWFNIILGVILGWYWLILYFGFLTICTYVALRTIYPYERR